jgi:membrane-associated phospholipid phosphatase
LTAETEPSGGTTPVAVPRPEQPRESRPPESARLLPATASRPALLVAACCAVIVGLLPLTFGRPGHPNWVDRSVDHAVKAMYGSGQQHLLSWLALPGTFVPVAAAVVIIVAACLLTRRPGGAALAVISVPVTIALTDDVLKPLVHRTTLGFSSYPSGHAASTFAIAMVLAVVLLGPLGKTAPRPLRLLITVLGILIGCVTSSAVIALGWHYCTDVIAGTAIAVGTVLVIALLLDRPASRRVLGTADRWLDRHVIARYLRRDR